MLKNVVEEIAKRLKIGTPEPDDEGRYTFIFDETLKVNILSTKKDSIVIVAPVSDALEDSIDTERLLKRLLEINFARLKDHQETLTWDPDSAQIILTKEIPNSELSERPMFGQLEKFLNNLEYWKTAIAQKSIKTSQLPQ